MLTPCAAVETHFTCSFLLGLCRVSCGPLAAGGKLAAAYADLLQQLWLGGAPSVAPMNVKRAMAQFKTQFSGFAQEDAQVWQLEMCVIADVAPLDPTRHLLFAETHLAVTA
jgi:hypothetical protein